MDKNQMTQYEQIQKIKAMNREEKRKLAKKLKMSYADLMKSLNIEVVDIKIDQIPEGTKVKINYDRIMNHKDELSERYIEWITEHKDEIFTCEKDKSLDISDTRVQLAEDDNEVKWLFDIADLILVDENGNAVGYTLD